jgi:hypothetical protein
LSAVDFNPWVIWSGGTRVSIFSPALIVHYVIKPDYHGEPGVLKARCLRLRLETRSLKASGILPKSPVWCTKSAAIALLRAGVVHAAECGGLILACLRKLYRASS